ncbi:YciI family protein [Cohnella nanjingensis]|uniref:YciI family protein n=1 Tax=Cohnella nanjingensis TaxID=1387779 RepID=A0A7X0VFL0_9BACL|nr:YciI family protein [Cohnella nanjingensis]MBB6671936.1 YciI family protein [Cohnella nanjingensis]
MRFLLIVRPSAGALRSARLRQDQLDARMKYNGALVQAGALLAAEDLLPGSNGIRIAYPNPGGRPVVTEGPFEEARDSISGFTLIEAGSREEAVDWAKRMPEPHGPGASEIEIRQVREAAELSQDPETVAMLKRLRG